MTWYDAHLGRSTNNNIKKPWAGEIINVMPNNIMDWSHKLLPIMQMLFLGKNIASNKSREKQNNCD